MTAVGVIKNLDPSIPQSENTVSASYHAGCFVLKQSKHRQEILCKCMVWSRGPRK